MHMHLKQMDIFTAYAVKKKKRAYAVATLAITEASFMTD